MLSDAAIAKTASRTVEPIEKICHELPPRKQWRSGEDQWDREYRDKTNAADLQHGLRGDALVSGRVRCHADITRQENYRTDGGGG